MFLLGATDTETNEYVFPRFASKNKKYNCPDCLRNLILCKGIKIPPYFRHKQEGTPCNYYIHSSESSYHKEGKLLIKQLIEKKLLKTIFRKCNCCEEIDEFDIPEISDSSSVVLEYRFNHKNSSKSADVAYIDNGELVCIFEICYKHKTNEEDRPEPWFEIDAVTLIKDINNDNMVFNCIRYFKCDECIEQERIIEERMKQHMRIIEERKNQHNEMINMSKEDTRSIEIENKIKLERERERLRIEQMIEKMRLENEKTRELQIKKQREYVEEISKIVESVSVEYENITKNDIKNTNCICTIALCKCSTPNYVSDKWNNIYCKNSRCNKWKCRCSS